MAAPGGPTLVELRPRLQQSAQRLPSRYEHGLPKSSTHQSLLYNHLRPRRCCSHSNRPCWSTGPLLTSTDGNLSSSSSTAECCSTPTPPSEGQQTVSCSAFQPPRGGRFLEAYCDQGRQGTPSPHKIHFPGPSSFNGLNCCSGSKCVTARGHFIRHIWWDTSQFGQRKTGILSEGVWVIEEYHTPSGRYALGAAGPPVVIQYNVQQFESGEPERSGTRCNDVQQGVTERSSHYISERHHER